MSRPGIPLLLILLLGACADDDRRTPAPPAVADTAATPADDEISHYTCPMHPSVHEAHPGSCPICGMTLVPVRKDEARTGIVRFEAARLQQSGVRFATVERAPLSRSIQATGSVAWDETKLSDVSLRVGGIVRELFADALGAHVSAGEPLLTLYSPELYAAQRELLEALRAQKDARAGEAPDRADGLVRAARARLRLWDVADADVAALVSRGTPLEAVPVRARTSGYLVEKNVVAGDTVAAGERILRIAPLDRVWVDAQVFESDVPLLEVGQRAVVRAPSLPASGIEAVVAWVQPSLDAGTRTARARLELANPALALRPAMWVEVELLTDLGERLQVPASAVIHAGKRRVVFVDLGDGRLEPRTVETGIASGDAIEITSGLEPGERVVASGNFLIAAESRLKSALEQW